MLSKENRLQKKKDIELVFKKGMNFREGFLALKTLKTERDKARFGFVISLKVSKKATIRNNLKRRLSELIRLNLGVIKPESDNLFIAMPGMASKDFWEIKEILEKLLIKAGLSRGVRRIDAKNIS